LVRLLNLYYKMKKKFSSSWIRSKQPRKQRKYRHNAPLHIRHRFLSAQLSRELRKRYGKRNIPLRKGDEVLVMRGSFAKKKGKILELKLKKERVSVEGLNRGKLDGTKVNIYFHPSNLQIQSFNLEDRRRLKRVKMAEDNKEGKKNVSEKI